MNHNDAELDAMKRYNLIEVLLRLGYVENCRKSSRHSAFLEHPGSKSKLVVSLNTNGHWRFFSIGSMGRGGTVVDALAMILGYSIGQCRQHMRPLLAGTASPLQQSPMVTRQLVPTESDVAEVRRLFTQSVRPIESGKHEYLNELRGISANFLMRPQFSKAVLSDRYGNAVFPHRGRDGEIIGAELRNHRFKGQIKGGKKTLWYSYVGQEERQSLVIAESGISACSYASLFFDAPTCYVSTGGTFSPLQTELLASAIRKLAPKRSGQVIAAIDHDDAGVAIGERIREIFQAIGRNDLIFRVHTPKKPGDDWNDVLMRHEHRRPSPHS